jgi:hypothetical protein
LDEVEKFQDAFMETEGHIDVNDKLAVYSDSKYAIGSAKG